MHTKKHTCPCCGYKTLESTPPGSFDICPICFWEDDHVQFDDPHYIGGANEPSLYEAQRNFLTFGACDKQSVRSVRKPTPADEKDESFQIFA